MLLPTTKSIWYLGISIVGLLCILIVLILWLLIQNQRPVFLGTKITDIEESHDVSNKTKSTTISYPRYSYTYHDLETRGWAIVSEGEKVLVSTQNEIHPLRTSQTMNASPSVGNWRWKDQYSRIRNVSKDIKKYQIAITSNVQLTIKEVLTKQQAPISDREDNTIVLVRDFTF